MVESYTEHVLTVIAHLVALEARTGCTVTLALEPEPLCFLETTAETIAYFEEHLYSGAAAQRLAKLAGLPLSSAHGSLRRHLGIVFDCCHQAIEYEDVASSLAALRDAAIPVFKLQEAAAVRVPEGARRRRSRRSSATSTRSISRRPSSDATASSPASPTSRTRSRRYRADPSGGREWRVHFHVPVFLDDSVAFREHASAIEERSRSSRARLSRQLEIETYTWDVLPAELKHGDIVEYVSRELEWVRGQLTGEADGRSGLVAAADARVAPAAH